MSLMLFYCVERHIFQALQRIIYLRSLSYTYNDTFKVRFYHGADWRAGVVETTANNGIGTPAGVRVGMPASVLSNVYGATPSYNDGGVTVKSYAGWGDNRYLVFRISNGKIKSIMAEFGE